jgi:hypothetical protein
VFQVVEQKEVINRRIFVSSNAVPGMAAMRVLPTSRSRIPCVVNDRFMANSGPSQRGNFESRMGGNFQTRRGGRFETRIGGKVDANMQLAAASAHSDDSAALDGLRL